MKFGHYFEEALQGHTYPDRWVQSAIPYAQLKKILTKVRQELVRRGYDPATLSRLLAHHEAEYRLETHGDHEDHRRLRPRFVVRIRVEDDVPVGATLSPDSWAQLQELTGHGPVPSGADPECEHDPTSPEPSGVSTPVHTRWIEVPLVADATFFDMLQADVSKLDALQKDEQLSMNTEIARLGKEVADVSRPTRMSKSDLYSWREIFELYLGAQVFFSTYESSNGSRNSTKARQQLVWFQSEVEKRGLTGTFKLASSAPAYARFLSLNANLLQNLQFQELNQQAVAKIIKKFDKKTCLGVKGVFPGAIRSDAFIADNVARGICAQLSQEVVSVIPQVDDYRCPVCFGLCWVPIRLQCRHLFCVRCVVKMQGDKQPRCPLCRADTVRLADCENLDPQLEHFIKRWFRQEVTEKQRANSIERGKELFGPDYKPSSCSIM